MGEVETGAPRSPAIIARVAGLLWLATIILGVFAEKFVRGELIIRGDAVATGANILASETLFRLGIFADLAGTGAYLGATFLIYALTRPVSRSLALFSALLGLAGSIVLIADLANLLEALNYLKGGPVLAPLVAGQTQSLAYMAIRAHALGYNLAMAVFAGQVLLLGWLLLKAPFLPRIFGLLFLVEGVCGWLRIAGVFLIPDFSAGLNEALLMPGLAAEGGLALWLLIMGVDVARWRETAARA